MVIREIAPADYPVLEDFLYHAYDNTGSGKNALDSRDEIFEPEVYAQIKDRSQNPQEKSYTNYLLDTGVDKICKKIGEEAAETIIAAKNRNANELTEEASDLLYHLLVLMFEQGVTLNDIQAKLSGRHK